ncbi:hypothetical protein [Nodosilinea sp. P-1105]|uniref:hypothetical protein n=1 Tax=Nodosilinea sp. P-1105 TaxID=2546229 RepID=UPI001F0D18EC|nr:hypothetical protein [Nodosilinea sp. P-1105]
MTQFSSPSSSLPGVVKTLLHPITLEPAVPPQGESVMLTLQTPGVAESTQSMVLAQQFDQDILGDMASLWNTFIESGQVWALLIGFLIGYMLRGITAY